MASFLARRWSKKDIGYQFIDTRDFGSGMNQLKIEQSFANACDKWAPHCGLKFTKVQSNADLLVKWGKLAKGIAGTTNSTGVPVDIVFNEERAWTESKFHPAYSDFLTTAMHELGHAIGLGHSDAEGAVMQPNDPEPNVDTLLFHDLGIDDAIGARVLYEQPCLNLYPSNSLHDKIMTLVNKTSNEVSFWFYINGDKVMGVSLPGHGRIPADNAAYWKETQLPWNIGRKYRIKLKNGAGETIRDGIEPESIILIDQDANGKPMIFLTTPSGSSSGPEGISGG